MAPRLAVLAIAGAMFLVPTSASAAVFCVADPGCSGTAAATLNDAITAANANAEADTIELGSGTFTGPFAPIPIDVTLVGSGPDATTLTVPDGDAQTILTVGAGAAVSDLGVLIPVGMNNVGINSTGANFDRVAVEAASGAANATGASFFGGTNNFRDGTIDLSQPGTTGTAAQLTSGSAVEDSSISSNQVGVNTGGFPLGGGTVRRSTVAGNPAVTVSTTGGSGVVEDALIRPVGSNPVGVLVNQTAGLFGASTITLRHATIVGDESPGSTGVSVSAPTAVFFGNIAGAVLRNVAISGVDTHLSRVGTPVPPGCPMPCFTVAGIANLDVDYSSYDPAQVTDSGPGAFTAGASNTSTAPSFVDAAAGDYRLRHDSALIDAGDPASPAGGESATDRGDEPRKRDGDGNGSEVADIGAYEYQRRAPVASATAAPTSGPAGTSFFLDASLSTDPDGDPLTSFVWNFGDGSSDSGVNASHVFATAGTFEPEVTVTDATGLTGTAKRSITVSAPTAPPAGPPPPPPAGGKAGRCANVKAGTARANRLVGTPLGDLIRGLAGNDTISGGAGDDCLFGGKGNDKVSGGAGKDTVQGDAGNDSLSGGAGADKLVGGAGKDKLNGGRAKDSFNGGAGNDAINSKDRVRETVNCGRGRDTVKADKRDRLRGCEVRKR